MDPCLRDTYTPQLHYTSSSTFTYKSDHPLQKASQVREDILTQSTASSLLTGTGKSCRVQLEVGSVAEVT